MNSCVFKVIMVALKSPFLVAKDLFVLNRAIGGFPISFNDDMTKFKFPLYEWYRLGILFICLGMQYINIPRNLQYSY